MDEREIEQGYADFHRKLNHILRLKNVRAFKKHVAAHPRQAGKLSHCLGLSDELAEVEMYKAVLAHPALKDINAEVREWLKSWGVEIPVINKGVKSKRRSGRRKS